MDRDECFENIARELYESYICGNISYVKEELKNMKKARFAQFILTLLDNEDNCIKFPLEEVRKLLQLVID